MLLFSPPYIPAAGAAIAGHDAPTLFKSSAQASSYGAGAWNYPVVAGELILVAMHALNDSGQTIDPTNFTVSLGGVALSRFAKSVATASIFPASAMFSLIAPTTGTLEFLASTATAARGCELVANRITGFDPTTPIGLSDGPSALNADTATLTGGAMAVGRSGNVVIGSACIKSTTMSAAAPSSAFDAVAFDRTGTTATSDVGIAYAYKAMPAAGNFTPSWTFDQAGRQSAVVAEINRAP